MHFRPDSSSETARVTKIAPAICHLGRGLIRRNVPRRHLRHQIIFFSHSLLSELVAGLWGGGDVDAGASGLQGGVFVALKGRVPVFVVGPVRKGQDLVADTCGCAVVNSELVGGTVFAVSLETNEDVGIKLVEALIL